MPRASATCADVTLLKPEMADQALSLELGERGERLLERSFARSVNPAHEPQVDDVERFDAEVPQIVVNRAGQVRRRHRRIPRGVGAANGADLGHDHQVVRIGVQRLADQLVGDVGAIEIAGVDVIDPAGDRLAQHGERRGAILRRPEYAGPGELHRAIAHAVDGAVAEAE